MPHDRALVVNRHWAGVFAALLVTLVVGCVSYAWSANAQIAVLQHDVTELKQADLPVRLARMEEKLDWLVQAQRRGR